MSSGKVLKLTEAGSVDLAAGRSYSPHQDVHNYEKKERDYFRLLLKILMHSTSERG